MLKKLLLIILSLCISVSTAACSIHNDPRKLTEFSDAGTESKVEIKSKQDSGEEIVSSGFNVSEQQSDVQIMLHIRGEEEGSGAVVFETSSIQEIIDYLNAFETTDFQGELQESYCVEVRIIVDNTDEVYEITTYCGDGTIVGKVLARKASTPEKWFLTDADIWEVIGQSLYLPFTYEDGEFVSRAAER